MVERKAEGAAALKEEAGSGTGGARRQRKELSEGARNEQAYRQSVEFLNSMSGWGGAEKGGRRGWIYWPTLDTKRDLDQYTRTELLRKSRWLRANMGLPNRICGGLADFIGYLTPQWNSGDAKWDEEAAALWEDRAVEPGVVDAAGVYGIDEMQVQLNRAAFGDGDILPVIVEGSTGGAMLALYEAHQLANPVGSGPGWVDGVRLNKFRRKVAFGIQGEKRVGVVSARDAIWYGHPDVAGRVRPPTILAQMVNHLHDVAEITADWKLAIKVAAQWGMYLKTQGATGQGGQLGPRAVVTGLRDDTARPPETDAGTAPAADGSDDKGFKVEDVLTDGGLMVDLPEGRDVGVVADDRPHPNGMNLLSFAIRDCCWASGVSADVLWDIAGLRGANNRLVSSDLARWIVMRALRLRRFMKKFCGVWAAREMAAGRLSEPGAGARFYRVGFIPQSAITADKGREGQLNLKLVGAGMRSLKTHFGEEGKNWMDELKQMAEENAKIKELFGESGMGIGMK